MPFNTDLSAAPFNSRYAANNDYYHIGFQPGVSVQARELNELQAMFAAQIERFGDNIFKTGTIVSGCNFIFLNPYPYAKLTDQDAFGNPTVPLAYVNNAIINPTTGLRAQVVATSDGFVSTDPDLKTIYLKYLNTGYDSNQTSFTAGDSLTVFDSVRNGIERVEIVEGGSGFSNTNGLFAVSALAVTPVSGTIANGEYIVNGLGANLEVIGVDSVSMAAQGQVILRVKPRAVDLANTLVGSSAWTIANGQSFTNSGNTASGIVASVIGRGYSGLVVTDSLGTITQTLILNKGTGYSTIPHVTLQSSNNASGYSGLELNAENWIGKVTIATTANPVGNGYAFGVNEGVIYLRGHFLRVAPQTVVVEKYSQLPDNVAVCFTATETLVDHNVDPGLEDPAAGKNNNAPGAERLKIVPQLTVVNLEESGANSSVLSLVEWNEGNPYLQRNVTQYSAIGDEMADRLYDQSGDFYINPFLVTTSTTQSQEAARRVDSFDTVIDAGSAYIGGHKVQTTSSYVMNTPFQYSSALQEYNLSLNYGNYILIKEVGGTFDYSTGAEVTLYSSPRNYLSNTQNVKVANTTPVGSAIGTAQIRNMQWMGGTPGTSSATWKLFLFDVQMNPGKNFGDSKAVYYNGAQKGIADIVLAANPTTATNVATIAFPQSSQLVFQTGRSSVKNSNGSSYTFQSLDQTLTLANTGIVTKSLASAGQTFPWFGATLTTDQMNELYLIPTTVDLVASVNASGTWQVNSSTANLTQNASGSALSDLVAGDWVSLIGNSTQSDIKLVVGVSNNSFVTLDSAPSFVNSAAAIYRTFPKNLPIPLGARSGITANTSANGTVLTINLGTAINQVTAVPVTLGAPVLASNVTPTAKTVNRNAMVRIACSNNAGGVLGPWCIGVPDVFRLRSVYIGNSTVSNTGTNYVSMFSIDNNQTPDFLDLSWLFVDNHVQSPLTSGSYMLVEFDYFSTTGAGYYATPSYTHTSNVFAQLVTDSLPLANLTSSASTWEVPEFFTDSGVEVDLLGCIDFRPYAVATVTPGSNSTNSPLNPSNVTSFSTDDKMFPVAGSVFTTNLEFYVPRIDTIYIDKVGKIERLEGSALVNSGRSSPVPPSTLKIADILVPEYPNLPATRSVALTQVINTGLVNTRYLASRNKSHSISLISTIEQTTSKVYTNRAIADIDTRLRNIEYYVALNTLENSVRGLVIPSSSDPTVNRYQFGFFADDFVTTKLSDLTNPGYMAIKEGTDIVPSKLNWEVYMGDQFSGSQSYLKTTILNQLNATIGSFADPTAQPLCSVALANSIAYQLVYRNAYDHGTLAPAEGDVDVVSFTLADSEHLTAGPVTTATSGIDQASTGNLGSAQVTLWFYAYDDPVQFKIIQGNTVVANSASAQALSANDITNLTTGTIMNQWFNDQTSLYLKNPVVSNTDYVHYAGKVTWDYAGSGNTTFSIRTTNGPGVRNWRWVLSYPINGDTAGCVPPPPPTTCPDGYYYDPITGGCILDPPDDEDPVVIPPVVNIEYLGCGNAGAASLIQRILQVLATGATIGTITVHDFQNRAVTGTLNDILDPLSYQNQLMLNMQSWSKGHDVALETTQHALNQLASALGRPPIGDYEYFPADNWHEYGWIGYAAPGSGTYTQFIQSPYEPGL